VNRKSITGGTALSFAATNGHQRCVDLLMVQGAKQAIGRPTTVRSQSMPQWHSQKTSDGICGEKAESGSQFFQGGKNRMAKDPLDTIYFQGGLPNEQVAGN
jgi:hypothetical protein